MTTQNPMHEEYAAGVDSAYQGGLDSLVAKWSGKDPEGYALPGLQSRSKRNLAAAMQENAVRSMRRNRHLWGCDTAARELFKGSDLYEGMGLDEVTQGSDIATIALQILPIITRAIASNPIFDLIDTLPMTGPSANIVYFDVLYCTGGAYSARSRVDINEDPTYSNRTDCTAAANELCMQMQRETTTATDKVLAGQICITAIQDAEAQFRVSLRDMLRDRIYRIMVREWARNCTDDIRTMATYTGSWSATAPGPYSSLNTNEWRKVLVETMHTLDASVRTGVYEPTEWILTTPAAAAIIERIHRPALPALTQALQGQAQNLQMLTGEFGEGYDRWRLYQDPYFAANTFTGGRKTFTLVPNSPYYFLPYQFLDNVQELFLPRTQVLEMGGITRAARKMIEPKAYWTLTVTS